MTDIQTLFSYRLRQAEETLADAQNMLHGNFSPRSIVNRAYYAMFYSMLALFLKENIQIKSSKHTGVISIFDKEFAHTGKIDPVYSKILHKIFDLRQEVDYREFVKISVEDALETVEISSEFIGSIKKYIGPSAG